MLILGDCLEKMKEIPDNSVDSIVTDPPYGLSFMGKKWDHDVPSEEIWREALRVLKPGGHLLAFFGTRTYHRGVVRIEDAGFEIRDQIQWIYGSGFPKSHNIKEGDFKGWGTALKPANEPIVLARKPLEGTVAQNIEKWGCGAINVDESRVLASDQSTLEKNWDRTAPAGFRDGDHILYGKGELSEGFENYKPQGRWPANIIFDEEAAALLDKQSGLLKSGKFNQASKKAENSIYGRHESYKDPKEYEASIGGASRFFYVAKASKRERNAGLERETKEKQGARPNSADASGKFPDHDHRETGGNNHPTVKPIKLMQYLCKLITPPNGTVLDPFSGSGSTGCAVKSLGFKFIGIEKDPEYFEIAKKRIENA